MIIKLRWSFAVLIFAGGFVDLHATGEKAGAPLARPATGNGSVRLVTDALRQESRVYKTTPQGALRLHFFFPPGWTADDRRPGMIFFFGGGWVGGTPVQFLPHAEYFAARGLVCASAEYRVGSVHHTTAEMCVEDAKSAIRWMRGHAREFGIDPERFVAAGGSAGGQLAIAAALVPGFDADGDDRKISPVANALVLFNPVLNLTTNPKWSSFNDAAGQPVSAKISPLFFLKKAAPPAIVFFGTADEIEPQGEEFLQKSRALGNRVELWTAADQPHGFFNQAPWITLTVIAADRFLASLGYLKGEPDLATPDGSEKLRQVK